MRRARAHNNWSSLSEGRTGQKSLLVKRIYEDLSFAWEGRPARFQNSIVLGLNSGSLSVGSGLNTGHNVSMPIDRETLRFQHGIL